MESTMKMLNVVSSKRALLLLFLSLLVSCDGHNSSVTMNNHEAGVTKYASIQEAAENGEVADVIAYLKNGSSIDEKDSDTGATALHHVMMAKGWRKKNIPNQLATLDLLIKRGANINATNNLGKTPLHVAAWNGNFTATEILLKNGADRTLKDDDGATPLDCAKKFYDQLHDDDFHGKVITLLQE